MASSAVAAVAAGLATAGLGWAIHPLLAGTAPRGTNVRLLARVPRWLGGRVPAIWRRLVRARRAASSADVLTLRSALASGASVPAAFDAVVRGNGPWAASATVVVRQLRAGMGLDATLARWAKAEPDGARGLVADALLIATITGGSQAGALDAVVSTLSERQALEREVRALGAQAKASAAVLVVTPILFAGAVAAVDPRIRSFYVGSVAGPLCLLGGLALDFCGAWWMARLVRRVS